MWPDMGLVNLLSSWPFVQCDWPLLPWTVFSASGSLPFFLIYPCCSDLFCFVTCASPWTLSLKSLLSWTRNISIGPIIQLEAGSCTLWHLFLFLLLHIQFTKFYKCCLLLVTSSLTLECPFLLFTLRYLTGLPDLTVRDLYKKHKVSCDGSYL